MTYSIFQFGQELPQYDVPVLNERAIRASAGILFFWGLICFMNAWLVGNFQPTRVFVVVFLIEFTIRLVINPRFAPFMILGEWAVRNQQPDWTGAPQKRFAWAIGFVLALVMLYTMVINQVVGPINLIVCGTCLTLMFFESAFGICLGCKIYNLFNQQKAQHRPGGACEMPAQSVPPISMAQVVVLIAFAAAVVGVARWVNSTAPQRDPHVAVPALDHSAIDLDPAEAERCKVPDFAKAMGHEAKWKAHNNCQ